MGNDGIKRLPTTLIYYSGIIADPCGVYILLSKIVLIGAHLLRNIMRWKSYHIHIFSLEL